MRGAIPGTARDHAATTHLEAYRAAEVGYARGIRGNAGMAPSGFTGTGWAVVDTKTGEPLAYEAWRVHALEQQADIEAERAACVA
jgi:hypothetical protein